MNLATSGSSHLPPALINIASTRLAGRPKTRKSTRKQTLVSKKKIKKNQKKTTKKYNNLSLLKNKKKKKKKKKTLKQKFQKSRKVNSLVSFKKGAVIYKPKRGKTKRILAATLVRKLSYQTLLRALKRL